jgi:hypothetical protein
MIEQMKNALEECKTELEIAESVDFESEIKQKVEEYEANLRKDLEMKRDEEVRDLKYQIRALEKLIEKETKKSPVFNVADNGEDDAPIGAETFRVR